DSLLIFTQCEALNVSSIRCDLFYRIKANGQWSSPKAVKVPTEFQGYSVSQPKLGMHPDTQELLVFFSSDAPNGKGGYDLWMGNWSGDQLTNIQNLESLNTPQDEFSPAYHEPHQQLWFSSNQAAGFGGYDIYSSQWNNGNWEAPENAGFPINSSYDDLYFYLESDALKAWWTSNRDGTQSIAKDEACCHDIFYGLFESPFSVPEGQEPPMDVVDVPPMDLTTEVDPPEPFTTEQLIDPPVEITPIETPEDPMVTLANRIPLPLYFHNDEPDSNSYSLTTRIDYQSTYNFYTSLEAEYITNFGQGNPANTAAIKTFFTEEVIANYEKLENLAKGLRKGLNDGKSYELGIRGYTSPRAPSVYNDNLAQRRIVSVILYFEQFEAGVLKPFIQSGRLKFQEVPFGEREAPTNVVDAYDQRRLSIYSVDASRERRVEIVFLKELD
ncbi:MAG: hypothetical protein AAFV80_20335, partial [Bacteroidota bacterium]